MDKTLSEKMALIDALRFQREFLERKLVAISGTLDSLETMVTGRSKPPGWKQLVGVIAWCELVRHYEDLRSR